MKINKIKFTVYTEVKLQFFLLEKKMINSGTDLQKMTK